MLLPTTVRLVPPRLLNDHVPRVISVQRVRTLPHHFLNFTYFLNFNSFSRSRFQLKTPGFLKLNDPGTGTPEACAPGTYQPETQRDTCEPCPEGKYCETSGYVVFLAGFVQADNLYFTKDLFTDTEDLY